MVDRSKLLFYSPDPIDKIVYLTTKTVSVSSSSFEITTFDHNLGFRPFITGEFSESSTFITSNTIGSNDISGVTTSIKANDTEVQLVTDNNSGSSITHYYRIYGFADEGADIDVGYNSDAPDNLFQFNMEFNYGKLYEAGTTSSVSNSSSETVTHDLGGIVQVRAWAISSGYATPISTSDYTQGHAVITATNSVKFINKSGGAATYHYRIYYDA